MHAEGLEKKDWFLNRTTVFGATPAVESVSLHFIF
jgi:hypothetical protein